MRLPMKDISGDYSDQQYDADESFFSMFLESSQKPKQARSSMVSQPPPNETPKLDIENDFLSDRD